MITSNKPLPAIKELISIFVERNEVVDGGVVHVLPEVRPSIQIMLSDPYWLRDNNRGASWKQLPRIAFWGPRYDWCYGHSKSEVKAFAIALTPEFVKTVLKINVAQTINKVIDLASLNQKLAIDLMPSEECDFLNWQSQVTNLLQTETPAIKSQTIWTTQILDQISIGEWNFENLARNMGISSRHFRRCFKDDFGISPKQFARIIRVDRMLKQIHQAPWETDIYPNNPLAFCDQPHSIREFKKLTGFTPSHYVATKVKGCATIRSIAAPHICAPEQSEIWLK